MGNGPFSCLLLNPSQKAKIGKKEWGGVSYGVQFYHHQQAVWDRIFKMAGNGQLWGRPEEDIIPFSVADMELETAPEIKEALKKEIDDYVLGYANPTASYRAACCAWQEKRHHWAAKPEWICPSHGVVDAFFTAVKAYTQPGDGVILLTPVYYPMYHAVLDTGRKLVDCPLAEQGDSYAIDFADFERKAKDLHTKMLILCSPHNPAGRSGPGKSFRRFPRSAWPMGSWWSRMKSTMI